VGLNDLFVLGVIKGPASFGGIRSLRSHARWEKSGTHDLPRVSKRVMEEISGEKGINEPSSRGLRRGRCCGIGKKRERKIRKLLSCLTRSR